MNYREYLLNCLAEELIETSKDVMKCARFTPEHVYDGKSNAQRVNTELSEVFAVIELLREVGISFDVNEADIEDKKRRLAEMVAISRQLKVIRNDTGNN
jgi:hypothetical protein